MRRNDVNRSNPLARLGDRLLARFVPVLDRPVHAADCWYEYRCVAPVLLQRHCCRPATGGVRCGPWNQIGYC
jgi:hypothetical protein